MRRWSGPVGWVGAILSVVTSIFEHMIEESRSNAPSPGEPDASGLDVSGLDASGLDVSGLDAVAALQAAVRARRAADAAEASLLAVAAHWADLHAVLPGGDAAGFRLDGFIVDGAEQIVPLAGEGTPPVAEFAPDELAAALGISSHAGSMLVGDALELRHRLPRLWARVHTGHLQAWRARQIAATTKHLTREAAAFVDAHVAPVAHKIGLRRILNLIDVALRRYDPEAAIRTEQDRANGRGVWLSEQMTDGTMSVQIEADALDVHQFDQTLTQIADTLAALGDDDRLDLRRAKAIGIIADPQGTLDLLHPTEPDQAESPDQAEIPDRPGTADCPVKSAPVRTRPRPAVTLYVHLSAAAVAARTGTARVEDLGPATLDLVTGWLQRADITLRPVLDLDNRTPVDGYETPTDMRETVLLRNSCCPFPWCSNLSRRKDMDHIVPYLAPEHGGPPGQTGAHLLGSPCRRHHRYKTTGGWTYTMPEPGIYLWRSPAGRRYLVDHTGTATLEHPA